MIRNARRDIAAVSEVVGSMLLIVMVFMLVLGVGGYVLTSTEQRPEKIDAGVEFIDNDDDTVTVEWTQKMNADRVMISNGTDTANLTSLGDTATFQPGPENARDLNVFAIKDGHTDFLTRYNFPDDMATAVYMESSTCDGPGYCGAKILLNDTEIDTWRGANVLVLDEQGKFYSYAWYDTHNIDEYKAPTGTLDTNGEPNLGATQTCSDCANDRLVSHIQSVPDGYYIVVVGDDQPGRRLGNPSKGINDEVENLYEEMGAQFGGDDILEYRDSWLIVSQKTDAGNYRLIFEKHAPRGDQSGVEKVSGFFYAPHDE